jgi:flagellar basal-body rod protein FlgG
MKAMWSAASGMKGLQLKIDTISNNLANVNTTGYKKQRLEFKDMMYEKMSSDNFLDGEGRPVGLEIGHGVLSSATARSFTNGNYEETNGELDVALNGDGFFVINNQNGEPRYTRDGSFKISVTDGSAFITTAEGYYVQGEGGDIDLGEDVKTVSIDKNGNISVYRSDSEEAEFVDKLMSVKFVNAPGLEADGNNLYEETVASGEAIELEDGESEIWQGYIETSNVDVVEEMINLITAQRAYEVNSKTIQTADSMLELASNLKR